MINGYGERTQIKVTKIKKKVKKLKLTPLRNTSLLTPEKRLQGKKSNV